MLHVCVVFTCEYTCTVYTFHGIELEVLVVIYHRCFLIFSISLLGQ